MSLEEIRKTHLEKLQMLRDAGMEPYPSATKRTHTIQDVRAGFSSLETSKQTISIAGRIRAIRSHGGSTFLDIEDGTGKLQGYLKEDTLGKDLYAFFNSVVDVGDIIEASGTVFVTKKEEQTLEMSEWRMLAKSLLQLPEKWHGLQDTEERFRKRYLDILMNKEVKDRFLLRSKILTAVRSFFDSDGFIEVETPMLQHIPGGALAHPFVTHHNALDIDLYLRVAPELYLKRLLVGGFEKVYEMGKSFRNEGIDLTHNPEFTSVEWYAAYWDEEQMMKNTERCFRYIAKCVGLEDSIPFDGKEISFKGPFARMQFSDVLAAYARIDDYKNESKESLREHARRFGIETKEYETKGKIADEIFKKVRHNLFQPTFVTNQPFEISPLAKRTGTNEDEVRRFQLYIGGWELVNAFSELNDPLDQRQRFEEQERIKSEGDFEFHSMDEDFIEALEYGMPPAAGAAIGIDRFCMLLGDTKSIREVLLFPTMRQK